MLILGYFDGYCKDWKDIDKMKSFISSHGGISDDFSVIVISTTARSGESIGSFNANSGKPYIDMKLYKFPCLKDVIINRKKLSLYTFSWIIVDHPDNYYCSGTDDFTNEPRVYRYVISKSLAEKFDHMNIIDIIDILNSSIDAKTSDHSSDDPIIQ